MDASTQLEEEEGVGTLATKRLYPLFVGQAVGLVMTIIVLVIVTRLLGPAQYGLYSFAFGYQAFVDGVSAWGIGAYFGRELAVHSQKRNLKGMTDTLMSGFAIIIPIGIIITLIGVAFSGLVANSWFQGIGIQQSTLILASLITFFMVMQITIYWALIGLKRSGLGAIVIVATDVFQFISIIVLVLLLGYGVNGAIGGMLIGYAIAMLLGLYFLYVSVRRYGKMKISWPSSSGVSRAWNFSLPVAANNFLNNGMQNFGILILGLYVSAATLGNYGAALRGLAMVAVVYATFNTVLLPTFSDVHLLTRKREMNNAYNRVIIYAMIPVVALLAYVAVFSKSGAFVMLSGSYTTAWIYLALATIGTLINLFGSYVSSLLVARGFTKELLYYNFYATIIEVISLVALVVLLPTDIYKVIGAIIASFFIGNIAASILFIDGAKKLMKIRFDPYKVIRLSLATLALAIILAAFYLGSTYLLPYMTLSYMGNLTELVFGFILMLIVFPVLIAVFKVVGTEDIASVNRAVAKFGVLKKVAGMFFSYMAPFMN